MIAPATILRAEAESLQSLAAMFRSMPGEFAQEVGAGLAVMSADFSAEALALKVEADRLEQREHAQ